MRDYTESLPIADAFHLGPQDLYIEKHFGRVGTDRRAKRAPLLFVHGAFTGSWMWAKYVPHFIDHGIDAFYLNLRGHYKSRSVDFSRIVFDDYVADVSLAIDAVRDRHGKAPILVGFSMGGLVSMKTAESIPVSGLVLIDSSICSEVHAQVPYKSPPPPIEGPIVAAPLRIETSSTDETANDIAFQRKYLSMEAANVVRNLAYPDGETGISVAGDKICCPCLVMGAIKSAEDDLRGRALASHMRGEYIGLPRTTHTGLLVGQRYGEAVEHLLNWLDTKLL